MKTIKVHYIILSFYVYILKFFVNTAILNKINIYKKILSFNNSLIFPANSEKSVVCQPISSLSSPDKFSISFSNLIAKGKKLSFLFSVYFFNSLTSFNSF